MFKMSIKFSPIIIREREKERAKEIKLKSFKHSKGQVQSMGRKFCIFYSKILCTEWGAWVA